MPIDPTNIPFHPDLLSQAETEASAAVQPTGLEVSPGMVPPPTGPAGGPAVIENQPPPALDQKHLAHLDGQIMRDHLAQDLVKPDAVKLREADDLTLKSVGEENAQVQKENVLDELGAKLNSSILKDKFQEVADWERSAPGGMEF